MDGIFTAILGFMAATAPVFYKLWRDQKRKKNQIEKLYQSNSFEINFKDLNSINSLVQSVLNQSQVSRFLLISAVNGKDEFNFVSVLYEQLDLNDGFKLSIGATSKYVDLKTDQHYKNTLKFIENVDPFYVCVDEMEHSELKQIYESEDLKYSMVHFLKRIPIDKENDRLMFCSWASTENEEYDHGLRSKLTSTSKLISEYL